ncbi:hypothetical protein [Sphingobium sp. LSP13-1-1.1]|uniref:hypothetical protein n=1 Tax=Sphingobium sp. LSP13-1-1.1 TaxID=3135234 RepID=UPI003447A680
MTAVNPLRGEAQIKVADATLKLVFDVNAFCYAQPVLNMKPLEILSAHLADDGDMLLTRTLLWAALQKHHPCHELEAGEILADAGVPTVRNALTAMFVAAFGLKKESDDGEGKKGENPPTTTPGTGSGSTDNTAKPAAKAKRSGAKRRN